jgi:ketosteroid isomerase-like protein
MTIDLSSAPAVTAPHFDIAVSALTEAFGDRLAPGITDFIDLFVEDAIIEVPFDGDGSADPIRGRHAIAQITAELRGILHFDAVTITQLHSSGQADVVICEYEAVLTRSDLGGQFARRYIAVATLREGRIAHLREYGGPFQRK